MPTIADTLTNLIQQFQDGQHDAVNDDDLHQQYSQVSSQVPQSDYEASAASAYESLTPEQRADFADYLRQQAAQRGIETPALGTPPSVSSDASALATTTAQMHQRDPNLLQQMFAPGGTFSSPLAKMVLLGITAFAAKRITG